MKGDFRARLLNGDLLVGTVVTLPTPEVTEILTGVGFDWLFVDAEHAPLEPHDTQTLLQATGDGSACLVRVPVGDELWIKKALDIGATGVLVPQVHTAEQAERVVQLCKYPPQGARGVGVARAHGYGSRFDEYMATANDQVVIVVQAESAEAVANIGSIARVPGIDAVLIGPYDLSASLGKAGEVDDPEVRGAMNSIRQACLEAGMRLGVFGVSAASVRPFIEQGFTLVAVGLDSLFLSKAAGEALSSVRQGD